MSDFMRILFVGDIVGKVGRNTLKKYQPIMKEKYNYDVLIVNGENAAHGKGINTSTYNQIMECDVDIITLGNHWFSKREAENLFKKVNNIVRPYNLHPSAAGVGSKSFNIRGHKLRVTNMLGVAFINEHDPSNPFVALDEIVSKNEDKVHIIDFHAEATGEKYALALDFDGKVSAVLGTHTHIQTVDARIFENGTGFISDVGMTGPYNSIIGCKKEQVIYRNRTGLPSRFDVAEGKAQFCAVVLDIDEETGRTTNIERIYILED